MNNRYFENWNTIIKLAWPLIVANSFWNLQLTVDRLFLANYSTDSLGAAMAVMGIFWVPMALLQQTAAYLTTFVAQYFGAKNFEMIGPSLWQSLYVSIAGGLLLLLLIPFSDNMFDFIGHAQSTRKLEIEYFTAICFSALPTALVAALSAFFTGLGNTRIIIWINLAGLVSNVIFDYLIIFGNMGFPALGITGAGYATALANVAAAILGIILVFTKANEKLYSVISGWKINFDLMKRFIKYGIPSGMQWALEGLAFSVFLIIIGRMENGSAALAASGIVVTIMMLSILPGLGFAQAGMVLMGQHLGEKKPAQAEISTWSTLQVALMYIIPVGVSFILFPEFFLRWFHNSADPVMWQQVAIITPVLLVYVGFFTSFDCTNLVFSFALKGAGDTRFVTLVALIIPWPLMILPTWLLKDLDKAVYLAWMTASVYIVIQALVFWRRFAGGKWKKMSVMK
jgi:MATE family multidrug resistance protein